MHRSDWRNRSSGTQRSWTAMPSRSSQSSSPVAPSSRRWIVQLNQSTNNGYVVLDPSSLRSPIISLQEQTLRTTKQHALQLTTLNELIANLQTQNEIFSIGRNDRVNFNWWWIVSAFTGASTRLHLIEWL